MTRFVRAAAVAFPFVIASAACATPEASIPPLNVAPEPTDDAAAPPAPASAQTDGAAPAVPADASVVEEPERCDTSDAGVPEGLCTPLDLTDLPSITDTVVHGAPPAMTGGRLRPGRYVLVARDAFCDPRYELLQGLGRQQAAIQLAPCQFTFTIRGGLATGGSIDTAGVTFHPVGKSLAGTIACGIDEKIGQTIEVPYTATADAFTMLLPAKDSASPPSYDCRWVERYERR